MIRVGEKFGEWEIVNIDYPRHGETWKQPSGVRLVSLMGPGDQFAVLAVPPKDQTHERIQTLLDQELDTRAPWKDREILL